MDHRSRLDPYRIVVWYGGPTLCLLFWAAVLLTLFGCASPEPWTSQRDIVGNVYPEECRHDLTQDPLVKTAVVVRLPRTAMDALPGAVIAARYNNHGNTVIISGVPIIRIADDLSGWMYQEVLFHEEVHVCMYRLHGDVRWHG